MGLDPHPLRRIPLLTFPSALIATEKGPLPRERSLAYDRPELLLHGPAATHGPEPITQTELAGYRKTATRLLAILDRLPFSTPIDPLQWPTPEQLLFLVPHLALTFDWILIHGLLEQAEQLHFHSKPQPFLHFRRA